MALWAALLFGVTVDVPAGFRVLPHLGAPHRETLRVTWFTTEPVAGRLELQGPDGVRRFTSKPVAMPQLLYSELEERERPQFPDMFANRNFKHQVLLTRLRPDIEYRYTVRQGDGIYANRFRTFPSADRPRPIRLIAFGDTETDYEGRTTFRPWAVGPQAPGSTGRPPGRVNYLATETQGLQENLRVIRERQPDALILAGDIVQGGGYQRAWDELWFHFAGKFDDPLGRFPMVAAIGNWENFGARNGGYAPEAVAASRRKYAAYFDGPSNGLPDHQNFYHRLDMGPVTLITLDSSNGLPDNTDNDTNKNIDAALYPGRDLVDAAPGGRMWQWTLRELADARAKGQVIFVQFHHIPYSGGGHSLPTTLPDSSGQAGLMMRAYTPWFQRYGVAAVFCGHNESFEWSAVGDVQFFDAGVAGDGLGIPIDDRDPRRSNPWRRWVAHRDEPENWQGKRLVNGAKHYGHLEVNLTPTPRGWQVAYQPVHVFPVTDDNGNVIRFERRPAGAEWSHVPNPRN
jgi:hypothetical protein